MIKHKTRYILFSIFFLALAADASAENDEDYIFSRVDYQTGLSHSAVLSMFQDNSGLMWLGTYDGVNCYDGKAIEVFRSDISTDFTLSNNVIHSICQAADGCLWLNTHLGLDLFSPEMREVKEVYTFGGRDYSIHSNRKGDTWVICGDRIFYYNSFHGRFCTVFSSVPASDPSDNRAFVTDNGELWHLPSGAGSINVYAVSSFDSDSTSVRSSSFIMDFHSRPVAEMFYQNGMVCFVDDSGELYVYDTARRSKIYIRNISDLLHKYGPIGGISLFYEDVIIGFRANGLVKLRLSKKYAAEEIDRNIRIYGLYSDSRQGILWIATDGQGAMLYSKKVSISANLMLSSLSANLARPVRSLMTDPSGGLWFGTKGDGIVYVPHFPGGGGNLSGTTDDAMVYLPDVSVPVSEYERQSHEFQVYTMLRSRYRDGFWVGSGEKGLYWFSFKEKRLRHVGMQTRETLSEIHAVHESGKDVLYITTADNGFHRLSIGEQGGMPVIRKNKRYTFYHDGHQINMFYPILADGDSLLWLGSRGSGLVRFDMRTEEYRVVSLKEKLGLAVDDILSLCKTLDGSIYVGTTSGLVRVRAEDGVMSFSYIGKEHGFLNDMIHGLLEDDDGFLWLGTNRGLVKYNPVNGSSHTYYYSAGVSVGEFCDDAYYKCPYSGSLFFGGVDGLVCLPPELSAFPDSCPDIVLRSVSLNRKQVDLSDCSYMDGSERVLSFKGPAASFSVSFAVPDYLNGKDVEYSYILDGFSDDWSVFGGSSEASFFSVPPGTYELRVRYKKDVFDTEFKSYSMPVEVSYPWYISRWAKAVYSVLIVLAAAFAAFYSRRMLRRRAALVSGAVPVSVPEVYDRLSVLYACCDRLASENIQYKDRKKNVEVIREEILSVFPSLSSGIFPSCPPVFRIVASQDIYSAVRNVLDTLASENAGVSGIKITIPKGLSCPVYLNAFRLVLYCCFRYLSLSGKPAEVEVSKKSGILSVRFVSDRDAAAGLSALMEDKPRGGYAMSVNEDMERFWKSVLQAALKQMEAKASCQDGVFCLELGKAASEPSGTPSGKVAVILTSSAEIGWLVKDILAGECAVTAVSKPEDAFEMMRLMAVSLLLVDMRMFAGKEGSLIRLMRQHSTDMAATGFIPMFAPVPDWTVYNELIRISDSYAVFPYDIPALGSVVHKVIYGKSDITEGYMDGRIYSDVLKDWDIELNCAGPEDTAFVRQVMDLIKSNLGNEDLGTSFLAVQTAMSDSRFYRYFKRVFNMPPDSLIKIFRLERAAVMLRSGSSVMDILCEIGISSRSYFYKEFTGRFGMTPKNFREKQ